MSDDLTTTKEQATEAIEPTIARREYGAVSDWRRSSGQAATSYTLTTQVGRLEYMKCLLGSDAEAQNSTDKTLLVAGWVLHEVDRVDDATGEVRPGLRLVLVTTDGQRISTGSGPLIDNWGHVCRCFADINPWPTLKITIRRVKRAGGKGAYLTLDPLIELVEPPSPAKRK